MLNSLKLKLIWSIIEQEADVSPKTSDSEIVQHVIDKLKSRVLLGTAEEFDIYLYVQSRISVIRDLAEIQIAETVRK